jgi:hypothetical protein
VQAEPLVTAVMVVLVVQLVMVIYGQVEVEAVDKPLLLLLL